MVQITARNAEIAALHALKANLGPAVLGFRFDRGLTGSVTVTYHGDALGAWWFEDGVYKFARIARQPANNMKVATPSEVVSKTVAMVAHKDPAALTSH